jgi:hypothetical protein
LQADLNAVSVWSKKWQLKLNIKKCVVLRLKDMNIDGRFGYYVINGVELKFVDHVKDLGVYISRKLDFTYQCNHIVNSAYKKIHLIFRSFITRDSAFMMKLFNVYVRPTLEYGSQVWSPFLLKNIDLIESVQRYYTRGIPGLKNFTYPDRLAILNTQSLELRRIRSDCVLLHKMLNHYVNVSFNNFFTLRSTVVQRMLPRNNTFTMVVPRAHLELYKHSFALRTVHYWNALSNDIVETESVTNFVRCLPNSVLETFVRGRTL